MTPIMWSIDETYVERTMKRYLANLERCYNDPVLRKELSERDLRDLRLMQEEAARGCMSFGRLL